MTLPPVLIFDFGAEEGQKIFKWQPVVQETVGIGDLASLLIGFRNYIREQRQKHGRAITTLGAIDDANLTNLLRFAYRASFQSDEGRPIRTRIAVSWEPDWHPDRDDVRFSREKRIELVAMKLLSRQICSQDDYANHSAYHFIDPIQLTDHKPLVKLSSLLLDRDGAICVREDDGLLTVTGMTQLNASDWDRAILRMPGLWRPSAGLLVETLDPGHVRVSEGGATFVLTADRIDSRESIIHVKLVHQWLLTIAQECIASFKVHPEYTPDAMLFNEQSDRDFPHADVLLGVWRILREAVSLGHGGAFAIVPDIDSVPITIKYKLEPIDLQEELRKTWAAHCKVWTSSRVMMMDHLGAAEEKRIAAHQWADRLASVGRLSAADGCVVIDRHFILHGFGGSIESEVREEDSDICHNLTSKTDVRAIDLLKMYGERHKSAFALCKCVPNAIVFVVSQDGDLRMFASDDVGTVYFANNLSF